MAKKPVEFIAQGRCSSCRHWRRLEDAAQMPAEDILGECLRYPPTITGRDEADMTLQDLPIVEALHYCGEYGMVMN